MYLESILASFFKFKSLTKTIFRHFNSLPCFVKGHMQVQNQNFFSLLVKQTSPLFMLSSSHHYLNSRNIVHISNLHDTWMQNAPNVWDIAPSLVVGAFDFRMLSAAWANFMIHTRFAIRNLSILLISFCIFGHDLVCVEATASYLACQPAGASQTNQVQKYFACRGYGASLLRCLPSPGHAQTLWKLKKTFFFPKLQCFHAAVLLTAFMTGRFVLWWLLCLSAFAMDCWIYCARRTPLCMSQTDWISDLCLGS